MALCPGSMWRRGSFLTAALVALANGGCLWVALGAAAGGTAAAVAYARGKVHATYAASFGDTWAATNTALAELGLPVLEEKREGADAGYFRSRNGDARVQIYLDAAPGKFPAEGAVTRVGVRVDLMGDYDASARILSQIGAHLTAVAPDGAPSAALGAPTAVPTGGVGAGWTGPTAPPPPANVGLPRTAEPPLLSVPGKAP